MGVDHVNLRLKLGERYNRSSRKMSIFLEKHLSPFMIFLS